MIIISKEQVICLFYFYIKIYLKGWNFKRKGENMEIYIYKDYSDWMNEIPSETLEGSVEMFRNGTVAIDTTYEYRSYRQIISMDKVFAIVYKMASGFLAYQREINIYETMEAWRDSTPQVTFQGQICEDQCTDKQVTFITTDGFKQIISLAKVFAVTYER